MEELTSQRPNGFKAQVHSGHINSEDNGSVAPCQQSGRGLRVLSMGSDRGFRVGLALAPSRRREILMSFTELSKSLRVASELPQNHPQQQKGPGQGLYPQRTPCLGLRGQQPSRGPCLLWVHHVPLVYSPGSSPLTADVLVLSTGCSFHLEPYPPAPSSLSLNLLGEVCPDTLFVTEPTPLLFFTLLYFSPERDSS